MEIRSTRSFNAILATLTRGVFNLYLNLLYKIYCKYLIYLFIHLFALSFSFNHCNCLFICGKLLLTYLGNNFIVFPWFIQRSPLLEAILNCNCRGHASFGVISFLLRYAMRLKAFSSVSHFNNYI